MNKYTKLIIWILVSSLIGSGLQYLLDAAGFEAAAEAWDNLARMLIGVGIGYFIFRD